MDKSLIETLSKVQILTLLLLKANNNSLKENFIQILMFILSRTDEELDFEFKNSCRGNPHSFDVSCALQDLESEGLIEIFSHELFITKKGKQLTEEIKKEFFKQNVV